MIARGTRETLERTIVLLVLFAAADRGCKNERAAANADWSCAGTDGAFRRLHACQIFHVRHELRIGEPSRQPVVALTRKVDECVIFEAVSRARGPHLHEFKQSDHRVLTRLDIVAVAMGVVRPHKNDDRERRRRADIEHMAPLLGQATDQRIVIGVPHGTVSRAHLADRVERAPANGEGRRHVFVVLEQCQIDNIVEARRLDRERQGRQRRHLLVRPCPTLDELFKLMVLPVQHELRRALHRTELAVTHLDSCTMLVDELLDLGWIPKRVCALINAFWEARQCLCNFNLERFNEWVLLRVRCSIACGLALLLLVTKHDCNHQ